MVGELQAKKKPQPKPDTQPKHPSFTISHILNVIRTAVSLGGDCDTLTCIAGSIGEGFYGVPDYLKRECMERLGQDLGDVIRKFDLVCH